MSNNLGLPLEYQVMPEFFDAHNINEETEEKNALIERLLHKHKVKTVLDLTCGTGSQVFYLTKHGYNVIGADISAALIKIAQAKAQEQKLDITFIEEDMGLVKVAECDAAISIFNAIGHLTKDEFNAALSNIRTNLKPEGIYVFDIFNAEALTGKIISEFTMDITKKLGDTTIHNAQYSTFDKENNILTSHDSYTVTKDGQEPKQIKNTFHLQIYTADELNRLLKSSGFDVIEKLGMDGKPFTVGETLNMLIVAKRTS